MDETKSSAFLAMEELLRAQSTQAHLKRQFVMAQVKEECNIKRDKFKKEEARVSLHVKTSMSTICTVFHVIKMIIHMCS